MCDCGPHAFCRVMAFGNGDPDPKSASPNRLLAKDPFKVRLGGKVPAAPWTVRAGIGAGEWRGSQAGDAATETPGTPA